MVKKGNQSKNSKIHEVFARWRAVELAHQGAHAATSTGGYSGRVTVRPPPVAGSPQVIFAKKLSKRYPTGHEKTGKNLFSCYPANPVDMLFLVCVTDVLGVSGKKV